MRLFEWWSIPRKGWLLILTELCVIIGLAGWVITEYVHDIFFQNYVNNLAPIIVPILGVALGITTGSAAAILYLTTTRPRRAESTHVIDESSGYEIQSERRTRRSTPIGRKAAKRALNPHREAAEPKQTAVPTKHETVPSAPPEKQEGT